MKHRQKIIILLFASIMMIAIVIIAFLAIAPIIYAQSTDPATIQSTTYTNVNSVPVVTIPSVPVTTNTSNPPATSPAPAVQSSGGNIGLVKCTGARDPSNPNDTRPICDFNYLLIEGRTVINWLFVISIPIAIVLFSYGGILYIIGTPGNRSKANGIFTAAGIGFGIMLIAWVSVYTIVSWLTTGTNGGSTNSTGITTFLGQ